MDTERKDSAVPEKGLLIILSGPSGAGKGTICKELLKRDTQLALSVSATTRAKGPGEVHGKDYYFCTDQEFQEIVDQDGFLEWAEVHGKRYGTLKTDVVGILDSGRDCILEIDVQGGIRIKEDVDHSCVLLFVKAPSEEELENRITNRNREKPEEIKRRMLTAQWEMTQEDKYQYSVVNAHVEVVVEEVLNIIREERKAHASTIH